MLEVELIKTCASGELAEVEILLKKMALNKNSDINFVELNYTTALGAACEGGHTAIVKKILKVEHIDVNKLDTYGSAPLHTACKKNHVEIINLLLAVPGIDVNIFRGDIMGIGITPFFIACQNGCFEAVVALLQDERINVNTLNSYGQSPLSIAFEMNHFFIVQMLLGHDRVDVNKGVINILGRTPLTDSCEYKRIGLVKMLLASPRIDVNQPDKRNYTALYQAYEKNHEVVIALLLADPRTDPNIIMYVEPIFFEAVKENKIEIVQLFLSNARTDVNHSSSGMTPFAWACENGKLEIIELLLKDPRTAINGVNEKDIHPLSSACNTNQLDVVKRLLQEPRIKVNGVVDDARDRGPLSVACEKGHVEIVKLLLALEDERGLLINKRDLFDNTPLATACLYGKLDVVQLLLADDRIDLNAGYPVLVSACSGEKSEDKKIELVRLLLENGADVNKISGGDENLTPFLKAVQHKNLMVMKLLAVEKIVKDPTFAIMEPLQFFKKAINKDEDFAANLDPEWQDFLTRILNTIKEAQADRKAIYNRKREIQTSVAADFNALVLYQSEMAGILKIKNNPPGNSKKFFDILNKLPQELQETIARRMAGLDGDILTTNVKIDGLKRLNKKLR